MSGTEQRNRISNPRFFGIRGQVQNSAPPRVKPVPQPLAHKPGAQGGFTYLALMIVIAVMGAALAAIGGIYSQSAQREKERELLFVGHQFRDAIASYYNKSPGAKAYPKSIDELLEDKRFPMPQRHLRKRFPDPMTGSTEWVLVEVPGGAGFMGVHSASEAAPIKTSGFDAVDAGFDDADSYAKWIFSYSPSGPGTVGAGQTPDPRASQRPSR